MADTELKVRITGDLASIRNSLAGLERQLVTLSTRTSRVGQQAANGLNTLQAAAARAKGFVVGLASSFASLQGLTAFVRIADQVATLNAKLRLATRSQEQFNRAQAETFKIAQRTRTSLSTVVDLYASLERSTRSLKLDQTTLLALTETINQAAQLSGGGPSVEAALIQLGQGLAEGTLRGDELNSVLSQTPRLAQAIADGMGIPIERIRKLAQEGKITAAEIARALLKARDSVGKDFAQLPLTISGAFTKLGNAVLLYFNNSKNANTAARQMADALNAVAENLPAIIDGFVVLGKVTAAYLVTFRALPALYSTLIGLSGGLATAQLTLAGAFAAAGTAGAKAMLAIRVAAGAAIAAFAGWEIGTYLRNQFLTVELAGIALAAGLTRSANIIKNAFVISFGTIKAAAFSMFNAVLDRGAAYLDTLARFQESVPGVSKLAETTRKIATAMRGAKVETEGAQEAFTRLSKNAQAELQQIDDTYQALADEAIARKFAEAQDQATGNPSVPAGGPADEKAKKLKKFYDQNLDLLLDATQRAIKEIDRLYEEGQISIQDYFAEKTRLEQRAIDLQVEQARGELALATERQDQERILANIVKLERDRAEIGPRAAREQAAAERELNNQLALLQAQLDEANGKLGEERRVQLEQERDALLRKFQSNPGARALVEQLFDVKLAQSRADAIDQQRQKLVSGLSSKTDYLNNQVELGGLSPVDAETQLQAARKKTLDQLIELRKAAQEAYNQRPSEETLAALQQLDTDILQIRASQETLKNSAKQGAVDALTGFFTDLATGAKSFKDAFKDAVLSFVQGLAKMAAEALAKRIILSAFNAFGGGGVGVAVKHSGGMAGAGMRRMIPAAMAAALFAGAPRFHSGGIAGLNPGEVPAILQTGERVLNRQETAAYQTGDRPAPGYRIVNVFDPSFVPDQMDSAAGEKVILNVIGRNPGRIKQIIG